MNRKMSSGRSGGHAARLLLLAALAAPLTSSAAPLEHLETGQRRASAAASAARPVASIAGSSAVAQPAAADEGDSPGYGTWFSWLVHWHAARGK